MPASFRFRNDAVLYKIHPKMQHSAAREPDINLEAEANDERNYIERK